jgi:GH15 family glucan-1,4-alpha-glucosidase
VLDFLPNDDPRMVATIEAVERDLLVDGFVLRYRPEETATACQDRRARSWPARSGS